MMKLLPEYLTALSLGGPCLIWAYTELTARFAAIEPVLAVLGGR